MIVDAHCHLEARMTPVAALLDQMDRAAVGRVALIAALQEPFETNAVAENAAALMRRLLAGRLRSVGLRPYRAQVTARGQFSMLGRLYPIYDVPDNTQVSHAVRAHPDRFYGWISVNPRAADACGEVERWAGQPGWIGVKAHPHWHRYALAQLDELADLCSETNLPLLVHLGGAAGTDDFRYLPERHPSLKVVYAHAGVPAFGRLWEYARNKPNIFVDFSCWFYVGKREMMGAIGALGVCRCLFGTDGPYVRRDYVRAVRSIRELPLPERDKERILGTNFLELTGIA